MNTYRVVIALAVASTAVPFQAQAVWDYSLDELVALVDASTEVCADITPVESLRAKAIFETRLPPTLRDQLPEIRRGRGKYLEIRRQAFEEAKKLVSGSPEQKRDACLKLMR